MDKAVSLVVLGAHAAFVGSTPAEIELFIIDYVSTVQKDKCRCYKLR